MSGGIWWEAVTLRTVALPVVLFFGRLAIITLVFRWVHVPCITTIEIVRRFGGI